MESVYKIDLDYEHYLFDPNYNESHPNFLKVIKEFEYVYFFFNLNHTTLKNEQDYKDEYLKYLDNLNFQLPKFSKDVKDFKYFWGKRADKNLEKKLNSKITSASLAKELGLGFFDGMLLSDVEKLKKYLNESNYKNFLMKDPEGFSGIGHIKIDQSTDLDKIKISKTMLVEPFYERVCDIGCTFNQKNDGSFEMFLVENYNNEKGSFKGGLASSNIEVFLKNIKEKYQFDLEKQMSVYQRIFKEYQKMGASSNVQIDSFIYKENNELKFYPLVEVNYRKTMGLVMKKLCDHFKREKIEWLVTHTHDLENKKEYIKLSPESSRFKSYVKLG